MLGDPVSVRPSHRMGVVVGMFANGKVYVDVESSTGGLMPQEDTVYQAGNLFYVEPTVTVTVSTLTASQLEKLSEAAGQGHRASFGGNKVIMLPYPEWEGLLQAMSDAMTEALNDLSDRQDPSSREGHK